MPSISAEGVLLNRLEGDLTELSRFYRWDRGFSFLFFFMDQFNLIDSSILGSSSQHPSAKVTRTDISGRPRQQYSSPGHNEILGDLQQEFAPALKKDQELPFEELGSALGSGFNRSLGKYLLGSRQLTALSHQNALLEEQLEGRELHLTELQTCFDELSASKELNSRHTSEEESMSVVQEELRRQAKYLCTLEWSNVEMSAELNILRERYTSVEVERAVLLIFPLPRS
ncbi:hypothetical protein K443DRAFT_122322 [Laccaria amethystina LaAM-08-1]|uniref:Fatty acid synthase subunit alpha acyl carrier domain-containing protein n=1 Tax=Laccaria amethystina LaAM-08-1 TaxID=1095629 RepID=A0A0C9Y0P4_9AGAR|nr:hypothetical protein K443DRAFT_122322 [Laccaria amethystina LaAM-08-1]